MRGAYLDTISAEGVVDNSYRGQNSNMHMCEVSCGRLAVLMVSQEYGGVYGRNDLRCKRDT